MDMNLNNSSMSAEVTNVLLRALFNGNFLLMLFIKDPCLEK